MPAASPFKFLDAYGKEDRDIFFGREGEVEQLYELAFESNLTLIYGQSGTGKTSLVQCGLANRFASSDWFNVYIRRNEDINQSLLNTLKAYDIEDKKGGGLKERLKKLREGAQRIKTEEAAEESELLRVLRAVYQHYFKPIYLIFDQFEELFILGSRPEQEAFYRSIAEILETEAYCHIIFIMREESIAQLYDFEREVPTLFDKRMRIEPLERKRTSEVISKTTAKFGITLLNDTIPGQIIELLSEGKGRVELTYLQVFLDQLYQEAAARSSNGVVFTENLIREFGNIENVLGDFLNKQTAIIQSELEKEFPEALSSAAAKVLNTFVTLEGTKRPLERQQVNVGGLSDAQISLVIGMLEKSRILRLEGNRYELAHDALAHQIARQRSAEEVSLLQIARIVRDRYRVYETTRTPLNSNELQLINTYRQQLEEEQLLSPEEWEFVRRSKRANRRRLILLVATVLLIIVSLAALALYSNYQRQEAQRQKQEAQRQEQEASRLLEEVQQAQEQQKAANYEKFFNEGKAAMAVADYSGAMQAFQTALVFDSLRQEARDSLLAAENKLGAGARFGQLIREGDALYNREDNSLYIDALRKYQEALRLNFNNSLAQSKIEATTVKLNAAFDALRDAGDTFFRTGSTFGYQQALESYRQAARIRPGDGYVQGRIREVREKLGE